MQFTNSDGSIVLSVKVDQSGLNKGMSSMKSGVSSISKQFKALGGTIATVFSIKAVWDFSKAAGQAATQTEASVQRLIDIYGEASASVSDFIDSNARAIGMSRSAAASFASVYGNLFSVWADQKTNAELTTQYLNMTAVVASKTGRTVADVQERVRSGLLGNTEAIEDLGVFVNVKTIEMTDAFKRLADGRSWEQLGAYEQQQVRTLAILEQATAKYGNQVAETTALTRARYQAAYEDFKATWGTVVNYVLMPVLKVATQIFNVLTKGLQVIAGLSGKTIDTSAYKEQEKSIGGAADNQKALTDEMKKTAKAQKKLLAGFDEIDILSENTSKKESSSTSDTSASDLGLAGLGTDGDMQGTIKEIETSLTTLMGCVGLALAAVGLILCFSGSIPWGIGFIIAGASLFMVSMAALSDGIDTATMQSRLQTLEQGIALALVAIGIVLLFLGQIPWGIGFIIAGGFLYAVSEMQSRKTDVDETSLTRIQGMERIVGDVFMALGIILLFLGQIPWGLGFIIAGAGVHAVSHTEVGSTDVDVSAQKRLESVMKIVGGSFVAIGLLLLFLGQIPWGLGFIATGAGLLSVSEIFPTTTPEDILKHCDAILSFLSGLIGYLISQRLLSHWTTFVKLWGDFRALMSLIHSEGFFKTITTLFGSSLSNMQLWAIAIGVIVGSITYFAANWDKLSPAQRVIIMLTSLAAAATAAAVAIALFHTSWSVGVAAAAIAGGIGLLATTYLFKKANEKGVKTDVSGSGDAPASISQYSYLAKGGTYTLPALAQGAVLPPNKPFMAIVGDQKHGTNIEAPAELIKQMAMEAMLEVGMTGQTTKEEHYYLGETELMSILYKLVKGGERLKGPSLISGGAY